MVGQKNKNLVQDDSVFPIFGELGERSKFLRYWNQEVINHFCQYY